MAGNIETGKSNIYTWILMKILKGDFTYIYQAFQHLLAVIYTDFQYPRSGCVKMKEIYNLVTSWQLLIGRLNVDRISEN